MLITYVLSDLVPSSMWKQMDLQNGNETRTQMQQGECELLPNDRKLWR